MICDILVYSVYTLLVINEFTSPRDLPETIVNLKIFSLMAVYDSPSWFAVVLPFPDCCHNEKMVYIILQIFIETK